MALVNRYTIRGQHWPLYRMEFSLAQSCIFPFVQDVRFAVEWQDWDQVDQSFTRLT